MKIIKFILLFILLIIPHNTEAIETDITKEKPAPINKDEILLDDVIDLDNNTEIIIDKTKDDNSLDFKLFAQKTFAERKTLKLERGLIDEISAELKFQGTNSFENLENHRSAKYPINFDLVLESKFNDNKYRFFTDYAFARDVDFLDNEFFGKFTCLFIERNINKNHLIKVGTSRSPIGLEGQMSSFGLPFTNRAQISRNFGNAISTGVSFVGKKDWFEYDIGSYTSTRYTQGFKDGMEFVGRVGFAPFYNKENDYLKNLKFYTGSAIGHRSENYQVYNTAITYEYKKFLANIEYAYANGSNGKTFVDKKQQGFFTTIGYNFTPKLQLLLRYDLFDTNTKTTDDINYEYSAGLNYFVFKQRLRFTLNYVFANNEKTNDKKNAIYFMTQLFI